MTKAGGRRHRLSVALTRLPFVLPPQITITFGKGV
jgi:hypothetical protein